MTLYVADMFYIYMVKNSFPICLQCARLYREVHIMDPHRQEGRLFGPVYTLLLVNNNMYSAVPVVWGCVHTVVSKQ